VLTALNGNLYRDKLEAGNMERRMRRMQGDQNSLFRKVSFAARCSTIRGSECTESPYCVTR
jgi:hypothetical protein